MSRIDSISKATSRQRSGCATVFLVGFLGIFVVVGVIAGYFMTALPLYRVYEAQSWATTSCQVISSRVVHSDDTSRPEIIYRYEVGGRQYTADRYNFMQGSTSDSTIPAMVARYSQGMRFDCFFDPGDPSRAVINREASLWFFAGVPFFVMFSGIPAGVGFFALRRQRRANAAANVSISAQSSGFGGGGVTSNTSGTGDPRFAHAFTNSTSSGGDTGSTVLKASASPLGRLVGVTLICLFWNGIVGVFTFLEYRMFMNGETFGVFMAIFLLLFQVVGVVLLVAVPYQVLALANPRPTITLHRSAVPLGQPTSFSYELTGATQRLTSLKIELRGREEARYRRGTDTHTDTSVFFTETLVDSSHGGSIARGNGTIRIPADSMHTFTADNNKVIWTLQVTGEIPRWPNVDESFDIVVRPA